MQRYPTPRASCEWMQRSWAFRTDNSGPPMNADEVFKQFDIARWQFQGADVYASTYDNFTAQVRRRRQACVREHAPRHPLSCHFLSSPRLPRPSRSRRPRRATRG